MVIDIIVPCVDVAFKNQVLDGRVQRRATPRWHYLVALRRDQSGGRERAPNELNRSHAMAKKQTDGSPPVQIQGQGFERVKWSDQDQSCNRSMPGEIGGDA